MNCSYCKNPNPNKSNYCGFCGKQITSDTKNDDYNKHVKKISLLFFTLLGYIAVLQLVNLGGSYRKTFIVDLIFVAIIMVFYLFDRKEINKLLHFKKLNTLLLLKILCLAPIGATLVYFATQLLNENVFDQGQTTYYEHFIDSPAPFVLSILSIAIVPAVFEEIVFRGLVFNELTNITSVKSAIIISAILFTILHLSLISIFWIFPIGLLFGYLRAKQRTLWYGIIGHFLYNSSIVIIELIGYANN
jgi:membrane protease YdiL (CAAX protease family)